MESYDSIDSWRIVIDNLSATGIYCREVSYLKNKITKLKFKKITI